MAAGKSVQLVGHRIVERVVAQGAGPDTGRRGRRSFAEVTAGSFVPLVEAPWDGGVIWVLVQEMRARRRSPG